MVDKLPPFEKKLIAWGKREKHHEIIDGKRGVYLEGDKLILEALAAKASLKMAWYNEEYTDRYRFVLNNLQHVGCLLRPVSERTMNSISGLETPPGIAAVCSEPTFTYLSPNSQFSLVVAITMVQDPGNLGTVLRTADFFGVDEVWLGSGSADPYMLKVIRGTMGSIFRLPVLPTKDLLSRIKEFREHGAVTWGAIAHGNNNLHSIGHGMNRILIVGGESKGIPKDYDAVIDNPITIPGSDRSESLNLAVAAGILIYSAFSPRE